MSLATEDSTEPKDNAISRVGAMTLYLEVGLGKLIISLSDEIEDQVRREIRKVYHDKPGAVSIFFETLVRNYLDGEEESE